LKFNELFRFLLNSDKRVSSIFIGGLIQWLFNYNIIIIMIIMILSL